MEYTSENEKLTKSVETDVIRHMITFTKAEIIEALIGYYGTMVDYSRGLPGEGLPKHLELAELHKKMPKPNPKYTEVSLAYPRCDICDQSSNDPVTLVWIEESNTVN